MATDDHEQHRNRADAAHTEDAASPTPGGYGAEMNAPHAVAGADDVSAENDASARAARAAGEQGGAGSSGLGGSSGGSGNYGGVGLPGGARTLGTGRAPSADSSQSGTSQSGGLGTPANAAAGSGELRSAEAPPGTHGGASASFQQSHDGVAAHTPSEHDHGGHLSLAGGSAGSGGGGADLLDDMFPATDTKSGA